MPAVVRFSGGNTDYTRARDSFLGLLFSQIADDHSFNASALRTWKMLLDGIIDLSRTDFVTCKTNANRNPALGIRHRLHVYPHMRPIGKRRFHVGGYLIDSILREVQF